MPPLPSFEFKPTSREEMKERLLSLEKRIIRKAQKKLGPPLSNDEGRETKKAVYRTVGQPDGKFTRAWLAGTSEHSGEKVYRWSIDLFTDEVSVVDDRLIQVPFSETLHMHINGKKSSSDPLDKMETGITVLVSNYDNLLVYQRIEFMQSALDTLNVIRSA